MTTSYFISDNFLGVAFTSMATLTAYSIGRALYSQDGDDIGEVSRWEYLPKGVKLIA